MKTNWIRVATAMLLAFPAAAVTTTWLPTSGTADWEDPTNWSNGVPQDGDHAVLATAGATARLSAPTPPLASVALSNGARLEFANWDTALTATNVTVGTTSLITCVGPFHEDAMSNRVWIVCSNLTLAASASINVDAKGYAGLPENYGQGPGGGTAVRAGGAYGGFGGNSALGGGLPYGSAQFATYAGSSGAGYRSGLTTRLGGHGGGAVRIDAAETVQVDGVITAVGATSPNGHGAGGAGGGISINCRTFAGGGRIMTDGGSALYGAGAGGRIAIRYDTEAQAAVAVPEVVLSARMGSGKLADLGTVWLPDTRFIADGVIPHTGRLISPGLTTLSLPSLTIDGGWVAFDVDGLEIEVAGNVQITGVGAGLELGGCAFFTNAFYRNAARDYLKYSAGPGATLRVGGDLVLTNSAGLAVYAGTTEPLIDVTGNVVVAAGCTATLYAHPTNGVSPLIRAANLTVAAGGTISADNGGYIPGNVLVANSFGFGPGAGKAARNGAGYGGFGGFYTRSLTGGMAYDSVADPREPGSAGVNHSGNSATSGGGLIRIESQGTVRIDGTLTASCTAAPASGSGGGSGGAITIGCAVFAADSGTLRANGGNNEGGANSGAGGGGRIAIRYDPVLQALAPRPVFNQISVRPGLNATANKGDLGTVFFPDDRLLGGTLSGIWGQVLLGTATFAAPNLLVTNATVRFASEGMTLAVAGNLTVGSGGTVEVGGGTVLVNGSFRTGNQNDWHLFGTVPTALLCGGDLVLTNGGTLSLYSGTITEAAPAYGGRLTVGGTLTVCSNSWLAPISHPTNGGSVFMTANRVSVQAGGSITATARGYAGGPYTGTYGGFGDGGGGRRNGGGYGGTGGVYSVANGRGLPYGSADAPVQCGSGGGRENSNAFPGGGLVWLQAAGPVHVDGSITANSLGYTSANACGSGGGVLVECRNLTGAGTISANGGNNGSTSGTAGAGGGGRVAVWYGRVAPEKRAAFYAGEAASVKGVRYTPDVPGFEGSLTATGGGGYYPGTPGTVTLVHFIGANGTMILLR